MAERDLLGSAVFVPGLSSEQRWLAICDVVSDLLDKLRTELPADTVAQWRRQGPEVAANSLLLYLEAHQHDRYLLEQVRQALATHPAGSVQRLAREASVPGSERGPVHPAIEPAEGHERTGELDPEMVGRKKEVKELLDATLNRKVTFSWSYPFLRRQLRPKATVISGIGGQGKTTIAWRIYHDADVERYFGHRRYFIDLETAPSTLHAIRRTVAQINDVRETHATATSDASDLIHVLRRWPTLLVLDNFETINRIDGERARQLVAALLQVRTLALIITTRDDRKPVSNMRWSRLPQLEGLDEASALRLFIEVAELPEQLPKETKNVILDVLRRIGHHPLSINLVAARCRDDGRVDQAAERIEQEGAHFIMRRDKLGDRFDSLEDCLRLSFEDPRLSEDARDVLWTLSWIDQREIEVAAFAKAFPIWDNLPSLIDSLAGLALLQRRVWDGLAFRSIGLLPAVRRFCHTIPATRGVAHSIWCHLARTFDEDGRPRERPVIARPRGDARNSPSPLRRLPETVRTIGDLNHQTPQTLQRFFKSYWQLEETIPIAVLSSPALPKLARAFYLLWQRPYTKSFTGGPSASRSIGPFMPPPRAAGELIDQVRALRPSRGLPLRLIDFLLYKAMSDALETPAAAIDLAESVAAIAWAQFGSLNPMSDAHLDIYFLVLARAARIRRRWRDHLACCIILQAHALERRHESRRPGFKYGPPPDPLLVHASRISMVVNLRTPSSASWGRLIKATPTLYKAFDDSTPLGTVDWRKTLTGWTPTV